MSETNILTGSMQADREKTRVAASSVGAAILLTSMKIIVGLLTGSLGILSEAAHSGLDLVAAAVTLFAVRVSGKPADQEHTYGHGKVENLSALFETVLLLLTCVWIIYEALNRLFFHEIEVEATIWSFLVMGISIAVDWTRSRALLRAAKKYDSQALEADALHFSTDIWSSSVVIVGLGLVALSKQFNLPWLAKADALSALGVAGIVIYISVQLGQRTVLALLDGVPTSLRDRIVKSLKQVPGVQGVERVRVRRSGPEAFADVILRIPRDTPLERAHAIATEAERAVGEILPGADVVVQVNPVRPAEEGLLTQIRLVAMQHGQGAHGIRLYEGNGKRSLELHLEVSDVLTVDQAHEIATTFEKDLRAAVPELDEIITHLEPCGEATTARQAQRANESQVRRVLRDLPRQLGASFQVHNLTLHRVDGAVAVAFHCVVPRDMSIVEAHGLTERMEKELRAQVPRLGRVVIHIEPPDASDA